MGGPLTDAQIAEFKAEVRTTRLPPPTNPADPPDPNPTPPDTRDSITCRDAVCVHWPGAEVGPSVGSGAQRLALQSLRYG